VKGYGTFDGYANRDSLAYRKHYGLENVQTLLRGTLRQEGYCAAWDVFVQLGLTDDTFLLEDVGQLTYAELIDAFLPAGLEGNTPMERLANFCQLPTNGDVLEKIRYTGVLDDKKIPMEKATPAQVLQHLLESKWVLRDSDKDMIVMQHQFEYKLNGEKKILYSSLVVKGEDSMHTAMAKTVGLPLGMCARRILNGTFQIKGVQLPIDKGVYEPILKELVSYGIEFVESL
jgi:saccharopine dehydrogenase-like NADP-dependent oxidoreductase